MRVTFYWCNYSIRHYMPCISRDLYHIELFKNGIQQISSLPVGYQKKNEHLRSIDKRLSIWEIIGWSLRNNRGVTGWWETNRFISKNRRKHSAKHKNPDTLQKTLHNKSALYISDTFFNYLLKSYFLMTNKWWLPVIKKRMHWKYSREQCICCMYYMADNHCEMNLQ